MTAAELRAHCLQEALRIWRTHSHLGGPGATLMPLLLEDYEFGVDVLFVGMNPSFSEPAARSLARLALPGKTFEEAFNWDPALSEEEQEQRLAALGRLETQARRDYAPYFRPLEAFAAQAGARSHAHIDMFLVRHTSQGEVRDAYGDKFQCLTPFAREQFDVFRATLRAMSPKTVVIVNAGASHIAREGLPLKPLHTGRSYQWDALPGVPIFLTGMLSGQRALDVFSRDRLASDVAVALGRAVGI